MNRYQMLPVWRGQKLNRIFCLAILMAGLGNTHGQVTVTSNPLNGATSISPSSPVVFTFSGPVLTNTTAAFYSLSP